jgi:signal peptidase I
MHRLTKALAVLGACALAGVVGFLAFVLAEAGPGGRTFRNVSHAMEPALLAGEAFTVRRVSPQTLSTMAHGTLIAHVFPPDRARRFIKRVVGMPGDTIAMSHGVLTIDGRPVAEPYAWHSDSLSDAEWPEFRWQRRYVVGAPGADPARYHPTRDNWGPLALPAGGYFVLGDNRDNSLDGRYWGLLAADDIIGEAGRVYFSWDATTGGIRWARIGQWLR